MDECGTKTDYPVMKIEENKIKELIEYLEQKPYKEVKDHISYLLSVMCSIKITGGVK